MTIFADHKVAVAADQTTDVDLSLFKFFVVFIDKLFIEQASVEDDLEVEEVLEFQKTTESNLNKPIDN